MYMNIFVCLCMKTHKKDSVLLFLVISIGYDMLENTCMDNRMFEKVIVSWRIHLELQIYHI